MNTNYVLSKFKNKKDMGGGRYQALCPAHDDHDPSLSITVKHDIILLRCHAGCPTDNVRSKAGLKWSDLFDNQHFGKPPEQKDSKGLTLEDYSAGKRLPLEFLKSLGMTTEKFKGRNRVVIPYKDANGKVTATRLRLSMDGPNRFIWRKGDKPSLYRLDRIKNNGDSTFLVEGESDAQTLSFYDFVVKAFPSANYWNEDEIVSVCSRYDKIYVVIEPDAGGKKVLENVQKSRIKDSCRLIQMTNPTDISDLYLSDPENFAENIRQLMDNAVPVDQATISPVEPQSHQSEHVSGALQRLISKSSVSLKEILDDKGIIDELAWLKLKDELSYELNILKIKENGLTARDFDTLKRAINLTVKRIKSNDLSQGDEPPTKLLEQVPDAPVSDSFVVPPGYYCAIDAIYKLPHPKPGQLPKNPDECVRRIDKLICTAPVVISKRYINLSTGLEHLELRWHRSNEWCQLTVQRNEVADSTKIVALANRGFPVSSTTARELVGYIYLFESYNLAHIPIDFITSTLGWQEIDGNLCFLLGRNYLIQSKAAESVEDGSNPAVKLKFEGDDAGDVQLAKSMVRKGSRKSFLELFETVSEYPVPVFMICGGLAAPLLEIFGQSSFSIDQHGPTTIGKTTCLQIAADMWGNPIIGSPDTIIKSWNSTDVYIERTLGLLNGVPLFLDDTKLSSKPDILSKVVYGTASGLGRGRGSILGTAETRTWRTVVLSTGENKLTDLVNRGDGGAHARVLSVSLAPFSRVNRRISDVIAGLHKIISQNYGVPSKIFLRYIIKYQPLWRDWQAEFDEITKHYKDKSLKSSIVARMAPYMASVHMAGKLAETALRVNLNIEAHMATVWENIAAEASKSSNIALEALKWVVAQAISKQDQFWTPDKFNDHPPLTGWLGKWNTGDDLAIISSWLFDTLEKRGYEPNSIVREWSAKRWLKPPRERKGLTIKVKVGKERPRCYIVKRRIIDKYC